MTPRRHLVRFVQRRQIQPVDTSALDAELAALREAMLIVSDRLMNTVKNSPAYDAETTRRDLQLQLSEGK